MKKFIEDCLENIIRERSVLGSSLKINKKEYGFFYSEADFQAQLTLEVEKRDRETVIDIIHYEYPANGGNIDLAFEKKGKIYPLELKYSYYDHGTKFSHTDKFTKDIEKIEKLLLQESKNTEKGYFIFLTDKIISGDNVYSDYFKKLYPVEWKEFNNFKYFIIEVTKEDT